MAKTEKEKLKEQLDLATDIYKAFCDGGQLSLENLEIEGIEYPHSSIKENLECLMKELAFGLHMTTVFPTEEEKKDESEGF